MLALKLLKDTSWLSLNFVCSDSELRELIAVPYKKVTFTVSLKTLNVIVAVVDPTLVDTLELFGVFDGVVSVALNVQLYLFMLPFESVTVNIRL